MVNKTKKRVSKGFLVVESEMGQSRFEKVWVKFGKVTSKTKIVKCYFEKFQKPSRIPIRERSFHKKQVQELLIDPIRESSSESYTHYMALKNGLRPLVSEESLLFLYQNSYHKKRHPPQINQNDVPPLLQTIPSSEIKKTHFKRPPKKASETVITPLDSDSEEQSDEEDTFLEFKDEISESALKTMKILEKQNYVIQIGKPKKLVDFSVPKISQVDLGENYNSEVGTSEETLELCCVGSFEENTEDYDNLEQCNCAVGTSEEKLGDFPDDNIKRNTVVSGEETNSDVDSSEEALEVSCVASFEVISKKKIVYNTLEQSNSAVDGNSEEKLGHFHDNNVKGNTVVSWEEPNSDVGTSQEALEICCVASFEENTDDNSVISKEDLSNDDLEQCSCSVGNSEKKLGDFSHHNVKGNTVVSWEEPNSDVGTSEETLEVCCVSSFEENTDDNGFISKEDLSNDDLEQCNCTIGNSEEKLGDFCDHNVEETTVVLEEKTNSYVGTTVKKLGDFCVHNFEGNTVDYGVISKEDLSNDHLEQCNCTVGNSEEKLGDFCYPNVEGNTVDLKKNTNSPVGTTVKKLGDFCVHTFEGNTVDYGVISKEDLYNDHLEQCNCTVGNFEEKLGDFSDHNVERNTVVSWEKSTVKKLGDFCVHNFEGNTVEYGVISQEDLNAVGTTEKQPGDFCVGNVDGQSGDFCVHNY